MVDCDRAAGCGDARSHRGAPPITPHVRRLLVIAAIALGAGLLGGLAGGALAIRLADGDAPAASGANTGGVPTTSLNAAIERVLPAVVTVLASLPPTTAPDGQRSEIENIGSGVVLNEGGAVLTNYHVVAGAAQITVVLSTGERRPAVLVADDSPFTDMAILRVPAGGLRAATLGDSAAARLGDPVAIVASGLVTYENQAKVGVISATEVGFPRTGVVLGDLLQTDAAMNHGDSGGALINQRGELIGLVTTVVRSTPQGQTVEGVGLAQSIRSLRATIDAVLATGVNPRPRLGIERLGTQHAVLEDARLPPGVAHGGAVVVLAVAGGSPAEAAGVRVGDVVVAVNNEPVSAALPFVNLIAVAGARDLRLNVLRDGRAMTITVTPRPIAVGTSR